MRTTRLAVRLAFVAALAGAAVGCRSSAPASFRPSLAWAACPADVESAFLSAHRCGYLTVLEDRTHPDGRRLRLLLVQVKPAHGRVLRGTATSIDADLGDAPRLDADASAYALRLHRTVVRMEPRGAGLHASPSLRCPEVDRLQARAVRTPTGDPALTAAFVAAVKACAARLQGQGVDLAAYDANAQAADLEDLRTTLGLAGWAVVGSYGSNDTILWSYLGAYPQRVDAAFSDSPSFPAEDPLVSQVRETREALQQLFHLCAQQPRCTQRHPDLAGLWSRALTRLAAHPLRGAGTAADGRARPVLVDAGRLVRTVRFALGGDGPGNVAALPAIIDAAAHGRLDPHLAGLVATDPVFCAGYRPQCPGAQDFSLGSFLSTFCRDQLPLADAAALHRATAGEPTYAQVFGQDPYVAACRAWPVGQAANPPSSTTSAPLLVISGQLDSFSSPSLGAALAGRQPHAWAVTVAGQTHNVLGFSDCAISARNAWTLRPRHAPDFTGCRPTAPRLE
jgi:hypothetical protein